MHNPPLVVLLCPHFLSHFCALLLVPSISLAVTMPMHVIPGSATSIVWDAYTWQMNHLNSPLAQATYTLEIFNKCGPDLSRSLGLLQPNNALRFALYTPQPYTPIGSGQSLCSSGYMR